MNTYTIEWTETRRWSCEIDLPLTLEEVRAQIAEHDIDSEVMDMATVCGYEVDGGIDWSTVEIVAFGPSTTEEESDD